jgi:hypothetical protein
LIINTSGQLKTPTAWRVHFHLIATGVTTALTANAHAGVTVITDASSLLEACRTRFVRGTTLASLAAA